MKLGGKCPLNNNLSANLLQSELQKLYNKPVTMSAEEMREEFCRKVCKNILC